MSSNPRRNAGSSVACASIDEHGRHNETPARTWLHPCGRSASRKTRDACLRRHDVGLFAQRMRSAGSVPMRAPWNLRSRIHSAWVGVASLYRLHRHNFNRKTLDTRIRRHDCSHSIRLADRAQCTRRGCGEVECTPVDAVRHSPRPYARSVTHKTLDACLRRHDAGLFAQRVCPFDRVRSRAPRNLRSRLHSAWIRVGALSRLHRRSVTHKTLEPCLRRRGRTANRDRAAARSRAYFTCRSRTSEATTDGSASVLVSPS